MLLWLLVCPHIFRSQIVVVGLFSLVVKRRKPRFSVSIASWSEAVFFFGLVAKLFDLLLSSVCLKDLVQSQCFWVEMLRERGREGDERERERAYI